ncbi:MAG: nucleotidyltransferase family protein [Gammaproteobacteria bacterium]|jgi:dTDP-glucose pyrophosphorylase|nr:nucleotidyltransferase family protein [Gammaproteobacteria bacterium]
MKKYEKLLLPKEADIHAAIEKLDKNEAHIVLVVDANRNLLGTVTDGDVRRGILQAVKLSDSVMKVMNSHPIVAKMGEDTDAIYALMRSKQIRQIPIVNESGQVCGIEILDDFLGYQKKDNIVVLMAGGMSMRLRPLTNDCPKPMLKVGGKPILETILTSLIQFGFHKFYISINYLANQIMDHFGDGSKWGVDIHYIEEVDKMGTAGPLSLLSLNLKHPLIVMNSDLLTKIDFNQLLNFHHEQKATATMCVREYDYTVPYGICTLENNLIVDVIEKPTYKFFINAGVYVLEPQVLNFVPKNSYFDMPTLFSSLIKQKMRTAPFPIREYWLDIGHLSDFEKAHSEYEHVFEIQEY